MLWTNVGLVVVWLTILIIAYVGYQMLVVLIGMIITEGSEDHEPNHFDTLCVLCQTDGHKCADCGKRVRHQDNMICKKCREFADYLENRRKS